MFEKTQLKAFFSKQSQTVLTGVGGKVVEARKEVLWAGQVAWVLGPAALWAGVLMNVTEVYSCWRVVKSVEVVTVEPSVEMVTIP